MIPPLLLLLLLLLTTAAAASTPLPLPPSDAVALLSFKSQADLNNRLRYTLHDPFDFCHWQGVKCSPENRVVRFSLHSHSLRGAFPPDTLTRLDQLRVLSLHNNSLSGPIPNLSPLRNLKSLFLHRNNFSGHFPPSLLLLRRLSALDLSFNNFSGPLPAQLPSLGRLASLQLQFNRFTGAIPDLNQSSLFNFNISANNFTGPVPTSLSRFATSAFDLNPGLCGEVVNRACRSSRAPFFDSRNATAATAPTAGPLVGNAETQSQGVVLSPPSPKNHKKIGLILGLAIGISLLVAAVLWLVALSRNRTSTVAYGSTKPSPITEPNANSNFEIRIPEQKEVVVKAIDREEQSQRPRTIPKSGALVFCHGEAPLYSLEQLMTASAELLGRGSIGTTYKAVLDNQLIVTVKRLDAGKTAVTSAEVFEEHMDAVGGLRHPYLVPVRAYFQAKGERLVIYDFQPNGSLFNLIHGSKSTRAKPLHWTSCLKIAEDVAQGLVYIHQSSTLIHGNLKSSNVLLGGDFEACLTDYGLALFADSSLNEDLHSAGYKAPEIRKSSQRATSKSDVYAFGILLLELLTGKHPSQHPLLLPTDIPEWVRAMRNEDVGDDNQLGMLTEVACICSLISPEQRPAMWQVLKLIHEIKESVMTEDSAYVGFSK